MANHLPDSRLLGAIHNFSCDILSAAVRGDPTLLAPIHHDAISGFAFDLAQHHIERCNAVFEAVTQRDPKVPAQ